MFGLMLCFVSQKHHVITSALTRTLPSGRYVRHIDFRPLREAPVSPYVDLHGHPLVRRYMPLSSDSFDERACERWIAAKERMWTKHGYGPWLFFAEGRFVG